MTKWIFLSSADGEIVCIDAAKVKIFITDQSEDKLKTKVIFGKDEFIFVKQTLGEIEDLLFEEEEEEND